MRKHGAKCFKYHNFCRFLYLSNLAYGKMSLSINKSTYMKIFKALLFETESTEKNLAAQKLIKEFLSKLYCCYRIEYCAAIKSNYAVHVGHLWWNINVNTKNRNYLSYGGDGEIMYSCSQGLEGNTEKWKQLICSNYIKWWASHMAWHKADLC